MALKLSEKKLKEILKENPSIKVENFNKNKDVKNKSIVDFNKICESILDSKVEICFNNKELLIILYGCRVLSLNQMMTYLQVKPRPYHMIKYKKIWQEKVNKIMECIVNQSIDNKNVLPNFFNFDKSIETIQLEVFRQSLKTIDEDSISSSFKYLIDGLRKPYHVNNKTYQILKDDNQDYITSIIPYQVKSKENIIAIKIKLIKHKKNILSIDDFKII